MIRKLGGLLLTLIYTTGLVHGDGDGTCGVSAPFSMLFARVSASPAAVPGKSVFLTC